ncbi:DUF3221 domain-containing protein [Bacillus sp. FJAT-49711]|uniref:DUF3221 domain-containing protein n=1 Tax=Bacillus sp. FJAT-49711 TaxID=2833585 RepID=UPI001BC9F193|nr:DUF3221 domain-containing protein [Bacillus sp. FJAT-49711]MBS4219810.1 DUF3221 domain-containing protein [Bacillus sp. FJAT-49711]
MKVRFLLFPMVIFLLFILAGCSSDDTIAKADSEVNTVNKPSKEDAYVVKKEGESVLVVDAKPQDFSATGGEKEFYSAIGFSNIKEKLEIGQRVWIEVDGPIMESYPAQAKAGKVEILPTYKPDKADLTEVQVVREAIKIADTKSKWFPAIRYVEYEEEGDIWKVGIKQEENEYELVIKDKVEQ